MGRVSIVPCVSGILGLEGAVQDLFLPFSWALDSLECVVNSLEPSITEKVAGPEPKHAGRDAVDRAGV